MLSRAVETDLVASRFSALDGYSLEATMPQADEIESLVAMVPKGTEIYLSAPPHRPDDARIDAAIALARIGLVPVPHVAARNVVDRDGLVRFLERMIGETGVDRLLLIGGDLDRPRGPYTDSASVIDAVPLREMGIREVGIAGYPEGHPLLSQSELVTLLEAKLQLARSKGLTVHVATQFCFNGDAVTAWLADFRSRHAEIPVKIGIAGPTGMRALLKFAVRCGVKAPMEGIGRKLATARKLVGGYTPDDILVKVDSGLLSRSFGGPTPSGVSAHFFSFGGLARTAEWAGGLGIGPAR